MISAERMYHNLQFLRQNSGSKDKYYESTVSYLEQTIKDGNSSNASVKTSQLLLAASLDITNFVDLVTQIIKFVDFRINMINL